VILPCFWWDNASPPGANSMFATNCDRLELSVGGTRWLTVTPDAEGFGALRYPPAFADLSGANAAAGTPAGSGLPDLRVDGYVGTRLVATLRMTADTSRDKLSPTRSRWPISAAWAAASSAPGRARPAG
jgi:beta-galactosidase